LYCIVDVQTSRHCFASGCRLSSIWYSLKSFGLLGTFRGNRGGRSLSTNCETKLIRSYFSQHIRDCISFNVQDSTRSACITTTITKRTLITIYTKQQEDVCEIVSFAKQFALVWWHKECVFSSGLKTILHALHLVLSHHCIYPIT
jgi:hypothetical protein